MLKKIISLLMVFVMCSGNITIFANSNISLVAETIVEDEFIKTVQYFGEIKIISWEDEDELIIEQYNSDETLVETNIGNKKSKDIVVENYLDEPCTINANDILNIVREEDLPTFYSSTKKVATIKAANILTNTRKTMNLFEEIKSAKNTTYKVSKYNGTLSNFITAVAIGIGVSAAIAGNIVGAFVSAGLGTITGKIIDFTSSTTLSCKKYPYSYYGQDSVSGAESSNYESGYKYVINDDEYASLKNNVYYGGLIYNVIDSDTDYKISVMLVRNLYGVDFDVYY